MGGLKFSTLLGGTTGFSLLGGQRESPHPLAKNYLFLPPRKISPVDFPQQRFIPPANALNSTFLMKIFFSEQYHEIRNALMYKVNCNLKECPSLFSYLYCLLKTMKLLNKCVICYFHYLKSILNEDSFKEYIDPVILIN